jgi:hypothetical protein
LKNWGKPKNVSNITPIERRNNGRQQNPITYRFEGDQPFNVLVELGQHSTFATMSNNECPFCERHTRFQHVWFQRQPAKPERTLVEPNLLVCKRQPACLMACTPESSEIVRGPAVFKFAAWFMIAMVREGSVACSLA